MMCHVFPFWLNHFLTLSTHYGKEMEISEEEEGFTLFDTDIRNTFSANCLTLKGEVSVKSKFPKELTPCSRPMSFVAKGKKKKKKLYQNQRQTNTSHCPHKNYLQK